MKIILMLLFITGSCGKYESSSSAKLGQRLSYEPQELNETQITQKQKICDSITSKTLKLSQLHGTKFSFNLSESNCSGETSQDESVTVVVEVGDGHIHFVRENGGFFIFKDAETHLSGVFKAYCAADKLPFIYNGSPTWVDQQANDFCTTSANATCVNFRTGIKETDTENSYRIVTQDSFKLDTLRTSSRYGFYTERVRQSIISCQSGTSTIRARLN